MIRQHLRQKLPLQAQCIGMEQIRLHQEILPNDPCPTFLGRYPVLTHVTHYMVSKSLSSRNVHSSRIHIVIALVHRDLLCTLAKAP